ncbi:MAG: PDZ domain-containing protein [Candidatus Nitronauta litoralis]|uniref:PDZ domain-containing protein n=1 Tax=Candidatus Nitronauta litoralis TaxID=2705533 RepID=A0A7T0BVI1_9BACT|nr:MAG: PDZ domain-containing protein [Candidatus Nitronauta litoralis]
MKVLLAVLTFCLFVASCSVTMANDEQSFQKLPNWRKPEISNLNNKEKSDQLLGISVSFDDSLESSYQPRAWLGVSIGPASSATDPDLFALKVLKVFPQSPAEQAGFQTGDLIVGLQGEKLSKGSFDSLSHQFRKQISEVKVGGSVRLQVERNKKPFSLKIQLEARPEIRTALDSKVKEANSVDKEGKSLLSHLLNSSGKLSEFNKNLRAFGQRADEVVSTAVKGETFNPFRLNLITSLIHRPLALPAVGDSLIGDLYSAWQENQLNLSHLIEQGSESLDYTLPAENTISENSPQTFTQYLDRLVKKLTDVQKRYRKVIGNLSPNEITRLENWFQKWMASLDREEEELTPKQKEKSETLTLDLLAIALKVDVQGILALAQELAEVLDIPRIQKLANTRSQTIHYPEGWTADPQKDRTLFHTPAGLVVIGNEGSNVYRDDAVLILDLGGNDIYRNHAGGARPGLPFSIVIDLAGNDRYLSDESFSQGAGFLGVGFLIDLEGDDFYQAGALAQGNGIFGSGLLVDLEGRDHYRCQAFCQASAAWGIGMLIDEKGYDAYSTDLYAQGFGFVKGFGALLDRAGNDHYFAGGRVKDFRQPDKATQSMAQGFGLGLRPWESVAGASGGIGILSDAGGNDVYAADYFAQGSSYWLALGILHDASGHDQYIAGRYAQGAGVHYSLGLLTDNEGDDQYSAHFGVSQGCGHDFAAGFLMDYEGDDRYLSGVLAQGVGNANGLGMLVDTGGRDEYFVKSEGQGRGHFEPLREMGSFGFLIDTGGGEDQYSAGAVNDQSVVNNKFGFTADIN